MRWVGLIAACVSLEMKEETAMTIVMGLDRHRAQITAEWIETDTGEVSPHPGR